MAGGQEVLELPQGEALRDGAHARRDRVSVRAVPASARLCIYGLRWPRAAGARHVVCLKALATVVVAKFELWSEVVEVRR